MEEIGKAMPVLCPYGGMGWRAIVFESNGQVAACIHRGLTCGEFDGIDPRRFRCTSTTVIRSKTPNL
jgi:hypothetical protein